MPFGADKNRKTIEMGDHLDKDPIGWLGPGIEIEGKMKFSSGTVRLNTQYKGDITCEGTLVVDDQGDVEAEINARIVSIAGKFKGTVRASERIEIKGHGIILGEIYTPSLVIDPGGFFDGQCHMPMPEPAEKQAPPRAEADKQL